jgi:hypothetical protein
MERHLTSRLQVKLKAYLPSDEIEYFLDELEPIIELWLENDDYSDNLTSLQYGEVEALRISPANVDEEDFELNDDYDFYSVNFKLTVQSDFNFTPNWTQDETGTFLHDLEIDPNFYSRIHIYNFSTRTTRQEVRG